MHMGAAVSVGALRLMVYDRTCTRYGLGLSSAWAVGGALYRSARRLDARFGATTWEEALSWIAGYERSRPIAEIQYWGHGRWGRVFVASDPFDASALGPGHRLHDLVLAIRERLLPEDRSLFWLRTCEAFGADAGHDFASRLAETFRARVAGHTHIIGAVQSGLRTLSPGRRPRWSPEEGLAEGTRDRPIRARGSSLLAPRTISCLHGSFPAAWFDEDGCA